MSLIGVVTHSFSDAQLSGDQGKKQSTELPSPEAVVKESSVAGRGQWPSARSY